MKEISIADLEKKLANPGEDELFIDVRSREEFDHEKINGFKNIPLEEIASHVPEFKDKKIILSCRTGVRCDIAAKSIWANDESADIINFRDSLLGWKQAGKPTERSDHNFFNSIKHMSIEQQIFIVLGAMLLMAGLTNFIFIMIGQSVVLLIALAMMAFGVTGMEPLIKFFEKLPWNKK